MREILERFGNLILSASAGVAAFLFTLLAFLLLQDVDEQVAASLTIGLFALLIVWVASEKPNSRHARAVAALIDRLLAVGTGDLTSPAPKVVRSEMPALASAVDALFEQVRSTIDNVHAMAMYDPVTSLPNRVHFKREAERMLKALPDGGRLALLFIDLDGFKEVNDSRGHAQGDQLLALVADRLRALVQDETRPASGVHPLLARLAGDEFTLLFPLSGKHAEAEALARRALAELDRPFETAGHSIAISASIGAAISPLHGTELATLMKAADIAMYHAKGSGRSQVCLYDEEMATAFRTRTDREKALRSAFSEGRLDLLYEPQLCLRSGAVVAGEAAMRWTHPDGSVQLQPRFLAAAEDSNIILPASAWLFEQVAAALGRWNKAGIDQRLSFNIGARQLARPDLLRQLRETLRIHKAPMWRLEIGVPEAAMICCTGLALDELAELRREGVSIAVDAFGSGYSNIGRLCEMPLDRLKLDRTLVADADSSEAARNILSAVIHLIHDSGLGAIAQGVERQAQLDVLRAIGCDMVQGAVLAPPMPEQDFVSWVQVPELRLPKSAFGA
jgi:diguanylate cyclase (GGDEF)-like protein